MSTRRSRPNTICGQGGEGKGKQANQIQLRAVARQWPYQVILAHTVPGVAGCSANNHSALPQPPMFITNPSPPVALALKTPRHLRASIPKQQVEASSAQDKPASSASSFLCVTRLISDVGRHAHKQAPHQRRLHKRRHRHVILLLAMDVAPAW